MKKYQIILPTGTGKTLIEADAIVHKILALLSNGIIPVIKFNTSTILLCFQLHREISNRLIEHGIQARYINFNSGALSKTEYESMCRKAGMTTRPLVSTTSPKQVVEMYNKAFVEGIPLIVISTYHSSAKFPHDDIDVHYTVNDEAHNCVSRRFIEIASLPSEETAFFTATRHDTEVDTDIGMNNEEIFGKIIYQKSSKEMIEVGEMVGPMIHVVSPVESLKFIRERFDKDYESQFKAIVSGFEEHSKKIKETSYDPNNIGAKLLVTCTGQASLMEMLETDACKEFIQNNPNVQLYALCSSMGTYDNGERCSAVNVRSKQVLIDKLDNLEYGDEAIILHVDMLSEGIDVPGITGWMPFKNSNETKFAQSLGRTTRLHPMDRERLYSGKLKVAEKHKWIKPYCWIVIPEVFQYSKGYADNYRFWLSRLRSECGYIPTTKIHNDNPNGLDDDEPIDMVNWVNKNRVNTDSNVEGFEHLFEDLTVFEQAALEDAREQYYQEQLEELRSLGIEL